MSQNNNLNDEFEKRAHIFTYAALRNRRVVEDVRDYVVRFAPIMDMLLRGELSFSDNIDWHAAREQVQFLTSRTIEK